MRTPVVLAATSVVIMAGLVACNSTPAEESSASTPSPVPIATVTPTAIPIATEATRTPPSLALQRGSFDEEAPFAGVFVLDLNERTWLRIAEDPAREPEPNPRLLAAFAPGELLAIATSADDVRIVDFEGNEVRSWPDLRASGGAFSPDGRYLGLGISTVAAILDVETGEVIQLGIGQGVWDVDWSPDGERVLLGTGGGRGPLVDGEIYLYSIDTGELHMLVSGLYPSWSPSGDRIGFVQEGDLQVVSADGTSLVSWSPPDDRFTVTGVYWLKDGTRVVASTLTFLEESRLIETVVLDATTGGVQYTLKGQGGFGSSPDGMLLGTFGDACTAAPYFLLFRPDGTEERRIDGFTRAGAVAWAPGGDSILSSQFGAQGGELWLVSLDGGKRQTIFRGPGLIQGMTWSAEGIVTFSAASIGEGCINLAPQITEIVFPD